MPAAAATNRFRLPGWVRAAALVLGIGSCLTLVAGLSWMARQEVDGLSTANSDNVQWGLAQAQVELLQFQLALEKAQDASDRLGDVKRRFDVFYSRVSTLDRGEVHRSLRQNPEFEALQRRVASFLEASAPLIDGPEPALLAALPRLGDQARGIGEDVRALSLAGLGIFADASDRQREKLALTLALLASFLAVLFAGLVLLAVSLARVARVADARAREVQDTAARLRTIVETSLDAIMMIDRTGAIREFNPAAQRIFGWAAEEAQGRRAIDLLLPATEAASLKDGPLRLFDESGRLPPSDRQFELTAMDRAGRRFPAEFSVGSADVEGDRVFVAFVRDISRRRAAEDGLTEARDRALAGERTKAEFVAVMSHEMRTPLNGLLGSIQLLRDEELNRTQSALLDRMESSGRLLLGLVNDVLDLAKVEAGKMRIERRPFSITQLLDGVMETTSALAAANDDELSWSWVGPEREGAVGDVRRIRQILLNLVGNALKFTHGGRVDIEVEMLGPDAGMAEFRVIDTGIGIAAEDLGRIFNDFETLDSSYARQAGGTGLGLGIARRLADLMGGEIGAESEPGEGSLFWLRVPVGPPVDLPASPTNAASPARPRPGRPLDLLLVEDNEINRFVARRMLEGEGHRVTKAVNGRAGVDLAEGKAFDAILMDISMPVMDGPEATRLIRTGRGASARTPIIAVTAHALPEEVARFREAGMADCISKPINRGELLDLLARLLDPEAAPRDAAPSPEPEADLIDEAHLSDLLTGLPEASRATLLERFLKEMDEAIPRLAAAPPEEEGLVAIVHKCAGSCGTFGLIGLRTALARIESAFKRGDAVDAAELQALADLWQRSRKALVTGRLPV